MSPARSLLPFPLALRVALLVAPSTALLAGAPVLAGEQRYYEVQDTGQKIGYSRVVWRDAKWQEKPAVHDSTLVVERGVRDMAGQLDVFETRTLLELDRGPRGELYHQRRRVLEGRRMSLEEVLWDGSGYAIKLKIGREPTIEHRVECATPVVVDTEAFLSKPAREASLRKGQKLSYSALDLRKRGLVEVQLEVLGSEAVQGPAGPVQCVSVREQDPRSGTVSTLWIGPQGTLVRLRDDQGLETALAPALQAMDMPTSPAKFSITVNSHPAAARIFNADQTKVKILFEEDPRRSLPEFPETPWSKVDSSQGNVIQLTLTAYDQETPPTSLPIERPERFARELEPTPLMPITSESLRQRARAIVGSETDARKAAFKLVRYVHDNLAKQSPEVASTTALEILATPKGDCSEHCVFFVALCRAIGIPARRVSGFVNIGRDWGAHDWAEIWTGAWVGADPTTGEIGTKARYIFFGYPDRAGSYPTRISAQTSGRMQILTTELTEGQATYALTSGNLVHQDAVKGDYHQLTSGIQIQGLPRGWTVYLPRDGQVRITSPSGLSASLRAMADQGDTLSRTFGTTGSQTYAGAPAWVQSFGSTQRIWAHARRRFIEVSVSGGNASEQAVLEKALRPTFSPQPLPTNKK